MGNKEIHKRFGGKGPLDSLLNELSEFGPAYPSSGKKDPLSKWNLIITTKREHLGGGPGDSNIYYAATNLPKLLKNPKARPKVYLHPAFFDLPMLKQLEILYWCLISQITKRITDPEKALKDAQMFIKFYRASKVGD